MYLSNYRPEAYDPQDSFETPPPGKYTAYVEEAAWGESKAGNRMIKITLSLSGGNYGRVFHQFVDNSYIQKYLDQFLESFGINPNSYNDLKGWVGKSGLVQIKNEEYEGKTRPKVHYFHMRKNQNTASAPSRTPSTYSDADENAVYEEDFPLDFSEMSDANEDIPFPGAF